MSNTDSIMASLRHVVLLALGLPALQAQSPSFLMPRNIPIGAGCCQMLTGDFNGDGKMDIAVSHGTASFTILLGNGDDTFTRKDIGQVLGSAVGLRFVADFNSDGILDIMAVVDTGLTPPSSDLRAYQVVVFLGNGDGSFRSPIPVLDRGQAALGVGDFNGDGIPDLLVSHGDFAVSFGNGDGTFHAAGPSASYPEGDCCFVLVGDFNHDGKADVAMISGRRGTVYVYLGNGDGTFQPFSRYGGPPATNGFKSLVIGDLNRDGNPDIVVGAGQGITVLLGKGDGTFPSPLAYPFAQPRLGLLNGARSVVADFNGDGIPDVLNGFTVFPGNGDGSLAAPLFFGQWQDTFSNQPLAAADFNGDGRPDLICVAPDGAGLLLLINNTSGTDASVAAVSAADYHGVIAPGSIASVFGNTLANATASAMTLPFPTVLGNTKVRILDQNGVERLAGLIYVSPTQINFLVPPDIAKGYAIINVDNGKTPLILGARSTPVRTVAPSFFTADQTGQGPPAATAVAVQSNGTRTNIPVFQCSTSGHCTLTPIDLNANGTVYLTLYGTGFANARSVASGGVDCFPAPVTYSGPQGQFSGLDQLNLQLPNTLPSGAVNITCRFQSGTGDLGDNGSASFTIAIK
jgi:uncharacterized protein (TIGR03437 family)